MDSEQLIGTDAEYVVKFMKIGFYCSRKYNERMNEHCPITILPHGKSLIHRHMASCEKPNFTYTLHLIQHRLLTFNTTLIWPRKAKD